MSKLTEEDRSRVLENLASLSEQEQIAISEEQFLRAKDEYERFVKAFERGECYLCHDIICSFNEGTPCIHWLLRPVGFKKKHLISISEKYGYFQIQSLLRWYASQDGVGKNINNIPEEGTGNKLIELTIKYKELEWSFSCASSDLAGHENARQGKHPHYHFQMRINNKPFIRFNETHLPFTMDDLLKIEAIQAGLIQDANSFGIGMNDILRSESPEELLGAPSEPGHEEDAPLKIDTFMQATEGNTIKGEDVYQLLMEAKKSGVTAASLMHKLPNATGNVHISRGPGVVDQAPRTTRKKKS